MEHELPAEYRNLMRAVIDAAARDYLAAVCRHYNGGTIGSRPRHCANIHVAARDWFLADDEDDGYPFTVTNICHVLGWDAKTIKRGVREREMTGTNHADN